MKNKSENEEKNIIKEKDIKYIIKIVKEIKREKLSKKLSKKKKLKDENVYKRTRIASKHVDEFLLKNYPECLVDYKIKKGYISRNMSWIEPVIIIYIIDKDNNDQFVHKRTLNF